ncbi:MAG: ABC transporter permease [Hyphomicrobiaceae bacterium]
MSAILASIQWDLLSLTPPGWGGNLLRGLAKTFQIALGAYVLGLTIGLAGALGKIYGGPVLRWGLEIYTTLIRAVPELVLILLLYYAGTDLLNQALEGVGYERVDISGLAAGIYVLGLVQGAYATEVLRGAILAVPVGQVEAAAAFGMSWVQRHSRIVIPAMIPFALPGLANLWLIVTKDTALLAVVGFSELALETRQAAGATKSYFMFYVIAAMLYLLLTLVSNVVFRWIEHRYRRGQPELN